jgi:hypothetical protein
MTRKECGFPHSPAFLYPDPYGAPFGGKLFVMKIICKYFYKPFPFCYIVFNKGEANGDFTIGSYG